MEIHATKLAHYVHSKNSFLFSFPVYEGEIKHGVKFETLTHSCGSNVTFISVLVVGYVKAIFSTNATLIHLKALAFHRFVKALVY